MSELHQLFDNKISHIAVDHFLSSTQVSSFLKALYENPNWKRGEVVFEGLQPPVQLFASQYGEIARGLTEDQYLENCQNYLNIWKTITDKAGFDPYELLIHYIKQNLNITIHNARKNNDFYCPLMGRDLDIEILPHADFGPYDGKDWVINKVIKQVAWNIYLTDPKTGGETTVYDYFWDENTIIDESSYGIQNFNQPIKIKFAVKPGKLVLFNSRNFHSITPSSAPRVAIGGLFGLTNTGEFIAWA